MAENGLLLRATAFALKNNDFYTYGEVVWNDYGRMITYHAGEYVRIKFPMPQLTATEVVTIHAGCDLDIATCINKFRNQDNFFGQTEIPVENPATRIP